MAKISRIWNLARCSKAFVLLFVCLLLSLAASAPAQEGESSDAAAMAVALFNQGQDAHEKGELPAALELYKRALAAVPEFPEAHLQRGNVLAALGERKEAESAFRRAVELKADWTLALATLGMHLAGDGHSSEAEKLLLKAIELDPQNFPAFSALAGLRLQGNAEPAALRDLLGRIRRLTAKANPTAAILASQAAIESELGDHGAAKVSADRSLALDSKNRTALTVLFETAIAERDAIRAGEIIRRYKLAPGSSELAVLRSRVLLLQDDPSGALVVLDAVPEPSGDVIALRTKITASQTTSVAELEAMLAKNAKSGDVLGRLCSALRIADPTRALDYCRRAAEAEPDNIAHAIGYGAALVQAKNYSAAVTLFRRILVVAPENASVRANLATALFQLKNYTAAKAEYQWLTQKQPLTAAAYFFLALTHDHLGEYLDAMANYQLFLKAADVKVNGLEIEKVKLRLPSLEKQIKETKGAKSNAK